jgi:hypothetical protein
MKRPYFFEIFTLANFLLIQILLWRLTHGPLMMIGKMLALLVPGFLFQLAIGAAIRVVLQRRDYLTAIRSREWLTDTIRIVIFSAMSVHTYGWIKLAVPLIHARLFDRELWDIDQAIFFGHSPNILFLDLSSNPIVLRLFDWTYAYVFVASIFITSIFFTSAPDRGLRIAFMNSNTLMWIVGSWLYVAIPSLGPAYRFPEVWLPLSKLLSHTQELQRILMTNYQHVLRHEPVSIFLGIGAFPSLHVAFEVLVWLWMRRVWRLGAIIFAIFSVIIFVGSVVTGWHYLIDSLAGVALAAACYAAVAIRKRPTAFSTACLN